MEVNSLALMTAESLHPDETDEVMEVNTIVTAESHPDEVDDFMEVSSLTLVLLHFKAHRLCTRGTCRTIM
jgi:hypothetical protein